MVRVGWLGRQRSTFTCIDPAQQDILGEHLEIRWYLAMDSLDTDIDILC